MPHASSVRLDRPPVKPSDGSKPWTGPADSPIVAVPAPPKPPLVSVVRAMFTAFGAMAFLVINAGLYLSRCTSTEFMFNCGGNSGRHTVEVLVIGAVVLVAAFLARRARAFAHGFFGALVGLAVVTTGACTPAWFDPYVVVRRQIDPIQRRAVKALANDKQRREWIEALNARKMDVSAGIVLAGSIVNCVRMFEARNGRLPADDAALAKECGSFADFGDAFDPGPPRRYVIPVPRGTLDEFGQTAQEVRGDAGWRAFYRVTSAGFTVRVVPDGHLRHAWPNVTADEHGRMWVTPYQRDAAEVSPVPELAILAECLKGIPAAVTARTAQTGGVSYGWALTSMTRKVCPSLSARVTAPTPNDSNVTWLSVLLPEDARGTPAPTASFAVQFEQQSPNDGPFAFALHVQATTAGLPRYFVTPAGAIHWTAEPRPATTDDPIVR